MPVIRHNLTPATKRKTRVRGKLHGTAERPRLTVFRSNEHLYLQAIDDDAERTIVSAHDAGKKSAAKGSKTERAIQTAKVLAALLKKAKIIKAVFDRGAYKYHGRVKAVADTLRAEGIEV